MEVGAPLMPPNPAAPPPSLLVGESSNRQEACTNLDVNFPPLSENRSVVSTPKLSSPWSSLFLSRSKKASVTNLSSCKPQIEDGVAVIPDEIIAEGIKEWKDFVVGYFVDKRMPFPVVKEALKRQLKIKGSYDLVADKELFYLKFSEEENWQNVLDNGPIFIAGRVFVMQKWSDNIEKPKQRAQTMLVWTHLKNLPKKLWSSKGLNFLASLIGEPICSDEATTNKTRMNYAKVCIEMKAGDEFPRVLRTKTKEGEMVEIQVEYPWKPSSCVDCCKFGHNTSKCMFNKVWVPKKTIVNELEEEQTVKSINIQKNQFNGEARRLNNKGKSTTESPVVGLPTWAIELSLSLML